MTISNKALGWISGWTFSAPPDALRMETLSAISVAAGPTPGCIELTATDARLDIPLAVKGRTTARFCAHGFRLVDEADGHDRIASVWLVEPTVLVIEADPDLLKDFIATRPFEHELGEAFWFDGEGQHHLGLMTEPKSAPIRLVVTSGTGDRESMRVRARGHLARSAHALIDARLAGSTDITPLDYLKSRLRPAAPGIPFPWCADSDDEPAWSPVAVYPVFTGLLSDDPTTAAGLIGNYLETMNDQGEITTAGGFISQPFQAPAPFPLLALMCWNHLRTASRLPGEMEAVLGALARYLRRCLEYDPAESMQGPSAGLYRLLLQSEIDQLLRIARTIGRASDEAIRRTVKLASERLDSALSADADEDQPWRSFLDTRAGSRPDAPALTAAAEILRVLADPASDLPADYPGLVLLVAERYESLDYLAYSAWVKEAERAIRRRWEHEREGFETRGISHGRLARIAGMAEAFAIRAASAFNKSKIREQRVLRFIENKRRPLAIGLAIGLVALVAFIISVQLRPTMPRSVFETNMGMALRFYTIGDYTNAIAILEDMQRRGSQGNQSVLFLTGKAQYQNKQFADAVATFQACIDANPDNPASYFNRGLGFYQLGDHPQAIGMFSELTNRFRATFPHMANRAAMAIKVVEDASKRQSTSTGDL